MRILAISGSTRAASTNTGLLHAAAAMAPDDLDVSVYHGLADLPIFSADLEDHPPAKVVAFKALIAQADGIVIASPEYVHAIPGGLKNAIDWLVSGNAIIDKPVVLLHGSHRGDDMLAALRLVLGTITQRFNPDIFARFALLDKTHDAIAAQLSKADDAAKVQQFWADFAAFIDLAPS